VTIEIHQPEIEDIIRQRLATGAFQDVEDVLIHALRSTPQRPEHQPGLRGLTGVDLLSAMQASPFKEIDLEPSRSRMPVRDVAL
jgi:hypothetical protein